MQLLRVVNFGSSNGGLSTVGYAVYGADGALLGARTTVGVVEIGTNTGVYSAKVDLPDYEAIVLWDTGGTEPRYSTEDYQHQITSINEQVGQIQKIYNSLRNQGEFFSALMDRMGMLEKNEGLQRVSQKIDEIAQRDYVSLTNIEEVFNRSAKNITLTAIAPEVKIPEPQKIPDYTNVLNELRSAFIAIRNEIQAVNKGQDKLSTLNNLPARINTMENKIQTTISAGVAKINNFLITQDDRAKKDTDKINNTLSSFEKAKAEIAGSMAKLTQYVYDFISSPYFKEAKNHEHLFYAFGHKRGK